MNEISAVGCHFADRDLAHAEDRFQLVGRHRLAHELQLGDVLLLIRREPQHAWQAEGLRDPFFDYVEKVLTRCHFDEFGEHPVRTGGVVLVRRAGRPVRLPLRESFATTGARCHLGAPRVAREPRRVEHHLFDGDVFLAVGGELRDHVRHLRLELDRTFAKAGPHRGGHERLSSGEQHKARVVGGVADRTLSHDLAVEAHGELRRG